MQINSNPPPQLAPSTEVPKKVQVAAANKLNEVKESNRADSNKAVAKKEENIKMAQMPDKPEPAKPTVNTSGQKTGTTISVTA